MAVTTTIAGASSDSYADVAYADAYFLKTGRVSQWDTIKDVSGNAQDQALFDAMLGIEAQDYIGERATDGQALQWPRIGNRRRRRVEAGTTSLGLYDLRGRSWNSNEIPSPIKNAQCEQALALGMNTSWLDDRYVRQEVTAGSTTLQVATAKDLGKLCSAARLLLDGLILTGGGVRRLLKS